MRTWEVVALGGGAATSGITYPLPSGERTAIGAVAFTLSATGGGGTRQVVVQLTDGTGATVYGVAAPGTHASGETVSYSFGGDTAPFGSGALGFMGGPFLPGWLPANLSVVVQVVSAGGGDLIDNGRLLVAQYEVIQPNPQTG